MDSVQPSFSFGENWSDFVRTRFSEERVRIARDHLLAFLGLPDLKGLTFLDIGCGSGMMSLAAFDAGASQIFSFDLDPASVATTEKVRSLRGGTAHWTVEQGSILDPAYLMRIEPADIAYSWGVLHHTGSMWEAVRNASRLVRPNGLFYLGLYTTTPKSPYWIRTKKAYNAAGSFTKKRMEIGYFLRRIVLPELIQRRNPMRYIRDYSEKRGMSLWIDIRDWLGGYPYEDASIEEVVRFGLRELRMNLINIKTGEAITEYLFHPEPAGRGD